MSTAFLLRYVLDPTFLVFIGFFALIRLFSSDDVLLIYALSYACHIVNLQAFIGRRYAVGAFIAHSVTLRTVALATLGILMWPYLGGPVELWALVPLGLGIALQVVALRALGLERTYYGVELGETRQEWIARFPYGYMTHPMAIGASLQFAGFYLLVPAFSADYPALVPGHLALTVITAVVEHFDWHLGKISDVSGPTLADRCADATISIGCASGPSTGNGESRIPAEHGARESGVRA